MRGWVRGALAALAAVVVVGWGALLLRTPAAQRDWAPDQARLARIALDGGVARIEGVRDFRHAPDGSVERRWVDAEYRLDDVRRVWFVLAPFATRYRALAHSFLSFEFADGRFLAVSVEARREADESYSLVGGLLRGFELAYVLGTEEDLLGLRAVRGDTLFVYPAVATPAQARTLLADMLERAAAVADHPEFYHTFWNNCTTNLRDHVNRVSPGRLPWGWGVLLPGFSDAMALEEGLLDAPADLEAARARFRVDVRAREVLVDGGGDFSARIRGV